MCHQVNRLTVAETDRPRHVGRRTSFQFRLSSSRERLGLTRFHSATNFERSNACNEGTPQPCLTVSNCARYSRATARTDACGLHCRHNSRSDSSGVHDANETAERRVRQGAPSIARLHNGLTIAVHDHDGERLGRQLLNLGKRRVEQKDERAASHESDNHNYCGVQIKRIPDIHCALASGRARHSTQRRIRTPSVSRSHEREQRAEKPHCCAPEVLLLLRHTQISHAKLRKHVLQGRQETSPHWRCAITQIRRTRRGIVAFTHGQDCRAPARTPNSARQSICAAT